MSGLVLDMMVRQLILVLMAGLIAGVLCRRLGFPLLLGYLLVGVLIGQGALHWLPSNSHELEYLAEAGVLLLLFSVGIEISSEELLALRRPFLVGGQLQMALTSLSLFLIFVAYGWQWNTALLIGLACSVSSTVLVFRALNESGKSGSVNGRNTMGILLFQDVALVPLMMAIPFLSGMGSGPGITSSLILLLKSFLLIVVIVVLRKLVRTRVAPFLAGMNSMELVSLFMLGVLVTCCWLTKWLGIPISIGALAAGLILSGNQLTRSIDSLILPFRECFSVIFFVTLGALLRPEWIFQHPVSFLTWLILLVCVKTLGAALAFRRLDLNWKQSLGMGLGLAQLGEFSFLILNNGLQVQLISDDQYQLFLSVAIASQILTPFMLKHGIRFAESVSEPVTTAETPALRHAIVIGLDPTGSQFASRLEMSGMEVTLIDSNPVALHPYENQGFRVVSGDLTQDQCLDDAGVAKAELVVVSLAEDDLALSVLQRIRTKNQNCRLAFRCRYAKSMDAAKTIGVDLIISEERELAKSMTGFLDTVNQAITNKQPAVAK